MMSRSPHKSRRQQPKPINPSISYHGYCCHFNNAIYMGGISAYKMHGRGMLLHDDGSCALVQHIHGSPASNTIIFSSNRITSLLRVDSNTDQVAVHYGTCIIKVTISNQSRQLHGPGVLIDFHQQKIWSLNYRRGRLVQKVLQMQKRVLNDVFKNGVLAVVIGSVHQQVFDLRMQLPQNVKITKDKNMLTIGFSQNQKINGLAFTLYTQNITSRDKPLRIQLIERGYYNQSKLQSFGQRVFQNGNCYVGQFSNGVSQGHGILLSSIQSKWIYGRFVQGKLKQILDSNSSNFTNNSFAVWKECLWKIHSRYRDRWIDLDIQLPNQEYLGVILAQAENYPTSFIRNDQGEVKREEDYRLGRIQEQFEMGDLKEVSSAIVQEEIARLYESRSNRVPQSTKNNLGQHDREKTTPIHKMKDPFRLQLVKIASEASETPRLQQEPLKQSYMERLPYYSSYYGSNRQNDRNQSGDQEQREQENIKIKANQQENHTQNFKNQLYPISARIDQSTTRQQKQKQRAKTYQSQIPVDPAYRPVTEVSSTLHQLQRYLSSTRGNSPLGRSSPFRSSRYGQTFKSYRKG